MSKSFPKRRTQSASKANRSELVDMLSNIEERTLELDVLRLDGGTQPRERLDEETRDDYVGRMLLGEDAQRRVRVLDPEGQPWPALEVFYDGQHHWLADGFHRVSAAQAAGLNTFQCRIHQGTQRDAVRHSLGVNARHGKRRTNADKRRAVERALADQEWSSWSDNKIAQMCKVSQPFVSKMRRVLLERGEISPAQERVGRDGEVYEVDARRAAPQPASRPASSAPGPSRQLARLDAMSFDGLDGHAAGAHDATVAYPKELGDWSRLGEAARADRVARPLAAVLPRTGDELWRGPAHLEGLAGAPVWCVLDDPEEVALVWSDQGVALPRRFATLKALLEHLGALNVAEVR